MKLQNPLKTRFSLTAAAIIPGALAVCALLAVLGACVNPSLFAPKAIKGTLDLSAWDFTRRGSVAMDGEWNFQYGILGDPTETTSAIDEKYDGLTVQVPDASLWQQIQKNGKALSTYGAATYRLTLLFPKDTPPLTFKLPEFFSASRTYLNGTLIHSAGIPGTTAETTTPDYRPGVIYFIPREGANELVIQIANFSERRGGINRSILVGLPEEIQTIHGSSLAMDLIIFGSLLTIGLYHLCLFWIWKKDRSPLWFGLFCLIIGIRTLIYGERFIFGLLPNVPWEVFNRIDHLTFYAGIPIFGAYMMTVFNKDISRIAMRIYQALGALFALFLFFPPWVFNTTVTFYELITGGYVLYIVFVIGRALYHRREGSATTLIGVALFMAFGINEILFNMGVVNTFNSLSSGLVLFLFTQSILIAMRFSKAFVESEKLGKTLLTMNTSLKRFIPEEFFRLLHRSEVSEICLGDQVEQHMTVMFADIRSFTGLAEQLGAAGTFTFLNDYFSRVGTVIRDNGGFIDKYMGDGFIALFPGTPDSALQAAVGIQKAVGNFNASRKELSLPPIEVGIGLNFGPLVLGTVGEQTRMDTTVIADAVNLCSRLESLTKVYGKGTIIPFDFMDRLENPDIFHWRYLGLIRVQGRKKPVEAIHIYDGLADVDFNRFEESKTRFEDSLHNYRNGDYELAMEGFRALARDYPDDPAPFTFMTQIRRLVSSGLADEWDGIESLPAK